MIKTFKVNGKLYTAKPFDFNMVCDFEEMGIAMKSLSTKPMSAVRVYLAICGNVGVAEAGKEMENHIINGGSLDDVIKAMTEEMNDSDFFRHLAENAEKETPSGAKSKKVE